MYAKHNVSQRKKTGIRETDNCVYRFSQTTCSCVSGDDDVSMSSDVVEIGNGDDECVYGCLVIELNCEL